MVKMVSVKGYFEENCYFYIDEKTMHGFLIDPGAQPQVLKEIIHGNGWTIEKILLTHGHFDHFGAANELRHSLRIPIYAYEKADKYLLDGKMNLSSFCGREIRLPETGKFRDGDEIQLQSNPEFKLKVLYGPGHTTDSVIFHSEMDQLAFVGDTVFRGSIGTDQYPGGNRTDLIHTIRDIIMDLPGETMLFSGHTECTTVNAEFCLS